MERRLYFIRHGESDANLTRTFSNRNLPHHLTGLGVEQARHLAGRLESEGIDALFCSPVPRAVETAAIVATTLGVDFEIRDELREFDVGRYEGLASREGWDEYAEVMEAWLRGESHRSVGGGESLDDVAGRFVPFVHRLAEDASHGERIALIGHGGVFHAGLPLVLPEVTPAYSWAHRISPTDAVIVAADKPMRCLRWCSFEPPFEEVAQSN